MTIAEKIRLAEEEVNQAEILLKLRRRDVAKWQNLFDLRTETLAALKEQAKPAKRERKD